MPLTSGTIRGFVDQMTVAFLAFVREEEGQDLIEYAFLAAFVGVAGYVALNGIVPAVATTYSSWLDPNSGTPSLWEPAQPWNSSGS